MLGVVSFITWAYLKLNDLRESIYSLVALRGYVYHRSIYQAKDKNMVELNLFATGLFASNKLLGRMQKFILQPAWNFQRLWTSVKLENWKVPPVGARDGIADSNS